MKNFFLSIILLLFFGCNPSSKENSDTSEVKIDKPGVSAHDFLIVDTHIDLPYRLAFESGPVDITKDLPLGHFDYVKAKNGGLDVAFMSIYTPPSEEGIKGFNTANQLIDIVDSISVNYPEYFDKVVSPEEVLSNRESGIISLPLGLENGSPINNDLSNLDHFYNRGIRYITLCHFKSNEICDSSTDIDQPHGGLSNFGFKVVEKMNDLGIMIDVSHVSDETISDVLKASKAPIIASHSGCRSLTPSFPRNLPDSLLVGIRKNGGVIMVNFGSIFLNDISSSNFMKIYDIIEDEGLEVGSDEAELLMTKLLNQYPVESSLSDILDHIDHVVKIAGIDHVGFGSDFDGVSNLPKEIQSVADYPLIIEGLQNRGYTNDEINKICGKNFMRVWNAVSKSKGI
ncbi:dipeptidase [Marinigracilibium pacificum]|uniref:Membrane dipeptidase n=1 Tax=Marinigracilibium pacificum TaxID=2729599 RepID=A0A848J3F9_9BACT|nr:dipeptidase [Marinigracilibium pacificum]NMM50261.1 membrane dipeptidase [Marinigracilibium pacificum]